MHVNADFQTELYFQKGKMMNDYQMLYSKKELATMDEK